MAKVITDNQHYADIGAAIRTKNETETLYKPSEMAPAILAIQGGVELNFSVVGGETAPENPAENTIWVNTSTEITGWSFSATEPTDPVEGMVWIVTSTQSDVSLNALTKDEIMLCLSSAQQYIDESWEPVSAETYQNGEWVSLWDGTLFDETGNQYEFITGGWIDAPRIAPSYTSIMPIDIGVTEQSGGKSVITINTGSASYYRQSIAWTKNKVDTTGFSALEIDVVYYGVSGDYGSNYESYVRITAEDGNDWYTDEVILQEIASKGTTTCPISTAGKYHIALAIVTTSQDGHVHIQISGVRLVK